MMTQGEREYTMIGLGERLTALRKAAGLTQRQMADMLCLHRTTYTKYERNNAEPSLEIVCRIATIFSMSVDELLQPNEPSE